MSGPQTEKALGPPEAEPLSPGIWHRHQRLGRRTFGPVNNNNHINYIVTLEKTKISCVNIILFQFSTFWHEVSVYSTIYFRFNGAKDIL